LYLLPSVVRSLYRRDFITEKYGMAAKARGAYSTMMGGGDAGSHLGGGGGAAEAGGGHMTAAAGVGVAAAGVGRDAAAAGAARAVGGRVPTTV